MKRFVYSLLSLVFLSACAGTPVEPLPATATPTPASATLAPIVTEDVLALPLSLDSDPEVIRLKLLYSHTLWNTVWLDARMDYYDSNGASVINSERYEVWIDQSIPRARVLYGTPEGEALDSTYLTGDLRMNVNLQSGETGTAPFHNEPFIPPAEVSNVLYPPPLTILIQTAFVEAIFPTTLAQRPGGEFHAGGMEEMAGRSALVAEWTVNDGLLDRFWIDAETGVLLRWESYGKSTPGPLRYVVTVDSILFDQNFSDVLFTIPPTLDPAFSDILGNPLSGGPLPAYPENDPLGDLYFFAMDRTSPPSVRLVRLPGSCVTGVADCPQPQLVETPCIFQNVQYSLVWSRDGSLAAYSCTINATGTGSALFVYDPAADQWTSLLTGAYIDPPLWSRAGDWIAVRVQDGQGGEAIYAVRPDGSEVRDLTADSDLPAEDRPYVMDGWIANNVILRSGVPGREGDIYLMRVDDGYTIPLFNTPLTKATFIPSPDGSLLAYDEYDYITGAHNLRIIAPDGSGMHDLAQFPGGSLYPVVWSPDITRLAWAYFDSNQPTVSAAVYVIRRDGQDLQQVYQGMTIMSLAFSPDGNFLLVEDYTNDGTRLFVVDLATLEVRLLQAPGLPMNADWRGPAWRP